jgi:hypothetical protein
MDTVYSSMRQHGLVRPLEGRMLGGVVAGLAAAVRYRALAGSGCCSCSSSW